MNDAGPVVPMADGSAPQIDAGGDAAMIAVDSGTPGIDAYVEGAPDAFVPPPDACAFGTWYADRDGDLHGDPSMSMSGCVQPAGFVASSDDCDDGHATVYPGATEICDGQRNDCTSAAPDAELLHTYYVDCDRDGFSASSVGLTTCQTVGAPPSCSAGQYVSLRPTNATNTDCNDNFASSSPNTRWYADCDGDYFLAMGAASVVSCLAPATNACTSGTTGYPHGQWISNPYVGVDCWDFSADVYPGETLYFTVPYSTGLGSSFDWDCDGHLTTAAPAAPVACTRNIMTGACGPSTPTWIGSAPSCGITGQQFRCGGIGCTATTTNVVAACR